MINGAIANEDMATSKPIMGLIFGGNVSNQSESTLTDYGFVQFCINRSDLTIVSNLITNLNYLDRTKIFSRIPEVFCSGIANDILVIIVSSLLDQLWLMQSNVETFIGLRVPVGLFNLPDISFVLIRWSI